MPTWISIATSHVLSIVTSQAEAGGSKIMRRMTVLFHRNITFVVHTKRAMRAYTKAGGRTGMGSAPCTRRREVPTRVWKALLKALLPTLGLPKVMHRMSAMGYCRAAQVAPSGAHTHTHTHSDQRRLGR